MIIVTRWANNVRKFVPVMYEAPRKTHADLYMFPGSLVINTDLSISGIPSTTVDCGQSCASQ